MISIEDDAFRQGDNLFKFQEPPAGEKKKKLLIEIRSQVFPVTTVAQKIWVFDQV